jgi:Protein of unknown function (DUF1761)
MNNFLIFVVTATILQYIISSLWYSVFFGKKWEIINGFDQYTAEEQKAIGDSMGPFYGLQLLITSLANFVFGTIYLAIKGNMDVFAFGGFVLLGFIIPAIIEGVIWGSTRKEFWVSQLGIMIFNRFINVAISCVVAYYFLR